MQVAQSYKLSLSKQSMNTPHWVKAASPSSPQYEYVRITPGRAWDSKIEKSREKISRQAMKNDTKKKSELSYIVRSIS